MISPALIPAPTQGLRLWPCCSQPERRKAAVCCGKCSVRYAERTIRRRLARAEKMPAAQRTVSKTEPLGICSWWLLRVLVDTRERNLRPGPMPAYKHHLANHRAIENETPPTKCALTSSIPDQEDYRGRPLGDFSVVATVLPTPRHCAETWDPCWRRPPSELANSACSKGCCRHPKYRPTFSVSPPEFT